MSFKKAIENTPLLKNAFEKGLKALGSNSSKVKPPDTSKCEGSIDIDTTVKSIYPNDSRWDYVVGYDGKTYFIEVHTAKTDEVKSVLNKLQWLKDFLIKDAPELNQEPKSFHWIASNGNHILSGSSQARQLAQKGITVHRELRL
ncbi:conserved hypothetical protein [Planktothrix sp. PCC 11201]|uniref:hypothetical protein n=1 Tax=Planktothrix sp. PCC 11201 TaxID=1729650 RepID=UPI00090EDA96|nr:hypothetical protein [Planktothrix sp. PCC 11201]SKB12415.1 conserved hypothetical protein [Planktothrix sp. PCC 11201]